jgi:hypothetical protein
LKHRTGIQINRVFCISGYFKRSLPHSEDDLLTGLGFDYSDQLGLCKKT